MALKPIKRKYSLSDSVFAEMADNIMGFARRDITELTEFGYNDTRMDVIEAKIADFKLFDSDDYFTALMMEATATKNSAIKNMGEAAEKIVRRGINKFGRDDARTRRFGFTGYAGKKDADKVGVCRQVHKAGTDFLTVLASEGLAAGMLDDLNELIAAADTAITDKAMSVSNRDIAVNQRIKFGNDLYADIVKVADTGKDIWEDSDESKYNDYVIYDNQPAVHTVAGTAPAGSVHAPSVGITADSDEIEITVVSGSLTIYYSDDPTDEPAPDQLTATVSAGAPYSGTAAALGWTSDNNRLLLQNTGVDDVQFTVVVRG